MVPERAIQGRKLRAAARACEWSGVGAGGRRERPSRGVGQSPT